MPSADAQSSTVSHVAGDDVTKINYIIKSLVTVSEYDTVTEHNDQDFTLIVNFYQEQPHVLDPNLQTWIDELLSIAMSDKTSQMGVNLAFKYLYLITKVRGQKYIVRLFPHEVSDIEIVLTTLESEKSNIWHAKYILFLWLSILVLIPFDLKRLDGEKDSGYSVRRMLKIATAHLEGSDKSSEAASLVVAKLVTRPDLHQQHLRPIIESLLHTCLNADSDVVFGSRQKLGCLTCIARIYKLGRREYLVDNSPYVLQKLSELGLQHDKNTLLRKVEIKLCQRLGLSFLIPRVAKWRYKRGTRLLADSFKKPTDTDIITSNNAANDTEEEEEDYEIPDEIEEVFDTLFRGLRDPETIVRWSAAKGVGRITARLPRSLATDVVSTLLECFSPLETSSSWHGGSLALAELGRHGYLLPEHLPDVVPVLIKALQYDEKRGNMVLGANVRDAACYISWSFARTYEPAQIEPFVDQIASALILTTLFDRHVSCRRAASAAFQENVGRQGSFPHGIDILTACDYYAVALQSNTYLKLSVKIAAYPQYTKPIIDFLAENRVKHWCPTIRRDASKALRLLCEISAEYIASHVLPGLLAAIETGDFNHRHGALLAISNICLGLQEQGRLGLVTAQLTEKINKVLSVLEDRKSFRGSGGDELRGAVCYYIEKVSDSQLSLTEETVVQWKKQLNLCLVNPEQYIGVQKMAVEALAAFSRYHYTSANTAVWEAVVEGYLAQLDHEFTATRVGAAYALSVLPGCVLHAHIPTLIQRLGECTRVRSKAEISLAECRVSAVKAVTNVFVVCELTAQFRHQVYKLLLDCLQDYSTDSRGDIGSYVREAAMTSLMHCNTHILTKGQPTISLTFTKDLKLRLVCGLLQQSVEKIDRTRQIALNSLHHLIHSEVELLYKDVLKQAVPPLPVVPVALRDVVELSKVLMTTTATASGWNPKTGKLTDHNSQDLANNPMYYVAENAEYFNINNMFKRTMCVIHCPEYVNALIRGLVVSIGGLTESLVKASSTAFVDYLSDNEDTHTILTNSLISVMEHDHKCDRVIVPLFKTVDLLLTNVLLCDDIGNTFIEKFVALLKRELTKCGNVSKLLSAVPPLTNCIQFSVNKPALSQIIILLCHRYPRVRKEMADAFYTALVSYDDVLQNSEEVMGIVESTVWDNPNNIEELRAERNKICQLLDVPVPKLIVSNKPKAAVPQAEQFDSYSDLVGRAGY